MTCPAIRLFSLFLPILLCSRTLSSQRSRISSTPHLPRS
jgi:hypothetical protein